MLLYASGSGTQKLNTGLVFYGGNIPSGDNRIVAGLNIVSTGAHYNYINASTGGGLYLASGLNGGTLAADNRDDAIIYLSQKRDIAGVASTKLAQSVAGPFDMPHTTLSGSPVLYPSGWSYTTGSPIVAAVVGSEVYGISDTAASGSGRWTEAWGAKNPTSGTYPGR